MSANWEQHHKKYLDTHQSDERRVASLNAYMDEALKYYKP